MDQAHLPVEAQRRHLEFGGVVESIGVGVLGE